MSPDILKKETETILGMMNISFKEVIIVIDNDIRLTIISIRVPGNEEELFTENHNILTRDLGTIIKQLLEKKYHFYKDVTIDINGNNRKFIEQAKQKAQIAVERVQFFDKPYEFGYLNSYERMLIHSYLKNVPNVITQSEGEGRDRRLIIKKQTI